VRSENDKTKANPCVLTPGEIIISVRCHILPTRGCTVSLDGAAVGCQPQGLQRRSAAGEERAENLLW